MTMARGQPIISFSDQDLMLIQALHDDPLLILLNIANCLVKRVLVDNESSVEVMFLSAFVGVGLAKEDIVPIDTPLVGFDGSSMVPLGTIKADVIARERLLAVEFVVVDAMSPYNVIIGRSWIHRMRGVPSTWHQVMRCIADDGSIVDIRGDQPSARKCFNVDFKNAPTQKELKLLTDEMQQSK